MPQYAQINRTIGPPWPVIGFFDTDLETYDPPPPPADLIALSAPDWTLRLTGALWTIVGTVLVAAVPSLTQQAATALAVHQASGIVVISTGTPANSATYALTVEAQSDMGVMARDSAAGLGLPGSGATCRYTDIAGVWHTFTAAQCIALYTAIRDLNAALTAQAAVMAAGGGPVWPAQTATIP